MHGLYYDSSSRSSPYDRKKAIEYAYRWAHGRNPVYVDFENFGGDCTNFASQCIFAGSGIMNYTPVYGWYYENQYNRTPSWTGVEFLYSFLVNNNERGPYAIKAAIQKAEPGDIIQLSFTGDGHFGHSPVIISTGDPPDPSNIRVAAHTDDQFDYPLTGYAYKELRLIHILGVRI